jgi:prevent-host-death family protein
MYRTREMQTKAKEILDAAEAGEDVRITRNGKVFKVVLVDAEPTEPAETFTRAPSDDLLAQLVEQASQQTDLLRQLVEQKDATLDDLIEQSGKDAVLDDLIEQAETQADSGAKATIWPRMMLPDPFPKTRTERSEEPSQEELRAAQEYFGLREVPDGLEITQKGMQSALAHMKKASREKPDSEEAKVIRMDPASEDRMEFIRLYQIDRYSKALAKRAAGDPKWLGMATPPRF